MGKTARRRNAVRDYAASGPLEGETPWTGSRTCGILFLQNGADNRRLERKKK